MTTGASLPVLFKSLRLPSFAENFQDMARHAEKNSLTFEQYLQALAEIEVSDRQERRIARMLRASKLPPDKKMETFDLDRVPSLSKAQVSKLCAGSFLDEATNILAFGLPGTGKSHLLAGIGRKLVEKGRSVLFIPAYELIQNLLSAKRDLRLSKELKKLDRFEALIVDDIGYIKHDRDEMEVLFTLLAERYERRSVLITSNLVFSKWDQIFKDPMTTAAAIDRLVHHSVILEMNVPSYRAEKAENRKKEVKKTKERKTSRKK